MAQGGVRFWDHLFPQSQFRAGIMVIFSGLNQVQTLFVETCKHLNCTGERKGKAPTVVLEAGSGDFSLDWGLAQPEVSRFAHVCSYDRAGSGWSELGLRPRTWRQVAYELHTALQKAGEKGPYLLAGHSLGGLMIRVYAIHPVPEGSRRDGFG